MVEQTSERNELLWTPPVQAMVDFLLVHGRVEMRFQRFLHVEAFLADVAHPKAPVESMRGGRVVYILFVIPCNLLVADNTSGIKLLNDAVNLVTVQHWGSGAGSTLQVMSYTGCSDKTSSTEGTSHVSATMGLGV